MRFATVSLAILATTTSSALANDVVTLFLPMMDEQPVEGKVIGIKGQMTSYVLNCPDNTPSESCGLPEQGWTMAQGPSTYEMSDNYDGYTAIQNCQLKSKSVMRCAVTMIEDGTTQVSKATITTDSMPFFPVTITATETEDLKGSSATKAATTKDTPSDTAATATGTATATGMGATATTGSGQGSTAAASASQTSSDNAAVATGSAMQWVAAGGAAMGVVLALV